MTTKIKEGKTMAKIVIASQNQENGIYTGTILDDNDIPESVCTAITLRELFRWGTEHGAVNLVWE